MEIRVVLMLFLVASQRKITGSVIKEYFWKNDMERQDKVSHTLVTEVSMVTSATHCAFKCIQTASTNVPGMFFNEEKGTCLCGLTLHRPIHLLGNSPGFHYYTQVICELEGYSELQPEFCVKKYENPLPHADAKTYCHSEGGRLARIDTIPKYIAVKQYLINVTTKTNMVYYIDGTINNGNCIFSDGTTIPAIVLVWAPMEPNSDECLSLYTSEFEHGDTTCFGYVPGFNFGFLCERLIKTLQ